jgi:hypothetical protein
MYMKVHEFRKELKNCFDAALNGDSVVIERGGVQFQLIADKVFPSPVKPYSPTVAKKPKVPAPLNIPGVVRASEAVCNGTHYMNRSNCGKPGCPWLNA